MSECIDHPDVQALEKQIGELKAKLAVLRRTHASTGVNENYQFKNWDGREQSLSQLFGDKRDLIIIHNMGKHCPYCTLWADGFNGLVAHLENRAAFFVVSNDAPDVQKQFAESRGWKFKMLSARDTSFFKDMGFEMEGKKYWPGASTFRIDDAGKIARVGHSYFGPGDDFCSVWHLFELLHEGPNKWNPKFNYDSATPPARAQVNQKPE